MIKKTSGSTTSSGSRVSSQGGLFSAIPVGITGILRRFWPFAKKYTQKFSEECENPEEKEKEFITSVKRDSTRWI
ncbi:hypothetical protein A3J90_04625 [candidate division WOR-1 bacterium RIFOXYC2_FULL_37_10]|uniref:Uncharacterized protein n=1 Tax=candidate division WOR-1 bacterium RIFOXYB2_FULL_37_13 TaxID=1802579 RepID=A0A1F4SLS0_UNCSA|nr:MAG: hypothetical protein A2246_02745 [candidate division WOR-1 bacterium RIFOXYA2_FULL_37_7]OGC21391.1 MAG: hypothetical protein A2310_01325 [candidate division WOR-1 bacterium RIFOXYB2_FULL_37_13]OGC33455.1 MAG: hypothetical protein A3J90_04625 [candidate division WOR-1 bacterium RIFOXYC2_FULL_37_10]